MSNRSGHPACFSRPAIDWAPSRMTSTTNTARPSANAMRVRYFTSVDARKAAGPARGRTSGCRSLQKCGQKEGAPKFGNAVETRRAPEGVMNLPRIPGSGIDAEKIVIDDHDQTPRRQLRRDRPGEGLQYNRSSGIHVVDSICNNDQIELGFHGRGIEHVSLHIGNVRMTDG